MTFDSDHWPHFGKIRPLQDVDVLAVLVLGRPKHFRKLTFSDVLVPLQVLVLAVFVQGLSIMGVIVLAVLVQKFSEIVVLGRPYLRPHPRRPRTPAGHENNEFGRCRHSPVFLVPEVPVLGHPLGPVLWRPD